MRKLISLAFGLFGVAGVAVLLAVWYIHDWADSPLAFDDVHVYELHSGTSYSGFARDLTNAGLLSGTLRFRALGKLNRADTSLQTGEYEFVPGITPGQLLHKVVVGDVLLHQLRIEEGGTTSTLLTQLSRDPRITHALADLGDNPSDDDLLNALGVTWPYTEGIFFPDTYLIRRGDSDRQILRRAFDAMQKRLDELWAGRGISTLSKSEVITLASIIEKETGRATDRAQISQVFHKRLQSNMLLQTDPTVIYALGADFDGNLTRAHLRVDSPYNTYRYKGLPPGPIALPSADSLEAALHPATTDYLYFVSRGDGTTQFSETLEAHNAAVRRFQLRSESR